MRPLTLAQAHEELARASRVRRAHRIARGLVLQPEPGIDGRRVAIAWRRVWERLPLRVRRALWRWWRRPGARPGAPVLRVVRRHLESFAPRARRRGKTLAWVTSTGDVISVWAGAARAPLDVLENLLAHEVGHAIVIMQGDDGVTTAEDERAADRVARTLGYDPALVDAWSAERLP